MGEGRVVSLAERLLSDVVSDVLRLFGLLQLSVTTPTVFRRQSRYSGVSRCCFVCVTLIPLNPYRV